MSVFRGEVCIILLGPADTLVNTEVIPPILNLTLRGSVPHLCVLKMVSQIEIIPASVSLRVVHDFEFKYLSR